MYSTEANAPSALGLNIMVSQIPVTNWLTNTTIDNTPKKYQKLKFLVKLDADVTTGLDEVASAEHLDDDDLYV